jgi:hypothetical protein
MYQKSDAAMRQRILAQSPSGGHTTGTIPERGHTATAMPAETGTARAMHRGHFASAFHRCSGKSSM